MSDKSAKCKCFEETLERVSEKLKEKIPEGSSEIEIEWENKAWILDSKDYSPVNPNVLVTYRKPKKGGGFAANKSKASTFIMARFCMFCGREYARS